MVTSKMDEAMKKFFQLLMVVAGAAIGLSACQNEFDEPNRNPIQNEVVVTFVAEAEATRTAVDTTGDKPVFSWSANETFAVLEATDALAVASNVTYENVDGKAHISAAFPANDDKASYQYVTVYPASGYVAAESISSATLALPASQTMAETSYDPNADLMVSKVVVTDAQPTTAQMVQFTRVAAVVKMTLKNFGVELGDEVEKVVFTAEGKSLAGSITTDPNAPHEFAVNEGVSSVSVATTSTSDVYFTVLPTTLETGDSYTITVITNKKIYLKQGTIPEDKSLTFEAGMVNRFGVNMMGVAASEKWTLVKDASTLKEGDIVTIAAKNHNYVIGKQGTNYPIASQTEVVKFGDYLYHPIATAETSVDNRMQCYTLMQRDANRVAFDFYNGVDYEGDTSAGFVYATGSNYSPKLQAFCDVNTLFDVTIKDGAATLCASEIEKTYKWWRYYHSTSAGSRRFDCTTSEPTGNNQVCIYKLEGAVGTIPVINANITVPEADETVVIAEEGATEPTAISTEQVTFNYVGAWTIAAEAEAEWLSVAYDAENNYLTYTAEPNTGAKRETTVTITATMEGKESLTWSFNITQKGAPQEITIAEFIKLAKDENSSYKLTGRITEMTTSNSGTFKLTDGNNNIATITYLYTDGGKKVSGNTDIDVKVGDVMTVTTVPVGSGKGGNSSHYSTYKGHYGLTTELGLAADYTGGSVEIKVSTYNNGNIAVPEAVEATMAENDYAEFSFADNTATINFTSENTTSYVREAAVTFTYGLTSATIIAQQGINPANKLGYELVTDASTLTVDDEVIIVAVGSDKALGCLASSASATGVSTIPAVDIEKSGNVIYDAEEKGVMLLTIKAGLNDGEFAFQFTHKGTDYYLNAPSSGLKGRAASSGANNTTSYAITIDAATGVATVQSSYPRIIKFNSKTGTNFTAFKLDAEGTTLDANNIAIYKKQK